MRLLCSLALQHSAAELFEIDQQALIIARAAKEKGSSAAGWMSRFKTRQTLWRH